MYWLKIQTTRTNNLLFRVHGWHLAQRINLIRWGLVCVVLCLPTTTKKTTLLCCNLFEGFCLDEFWAWDPGGLDKLANKQTKPKNKKMATGLWNLNNTPWVEFSTSHVKIRVSQKKWLVFLDGYWFEIYIIKSGSSSSSSSHFNPVSPYSKINSTHPSVQIFSWTCV